MSHVSSQRRSKRWILPLLCRRGHITRNEIGAIRIGPNITHFQVPRAIAGKFAAALQRTRDVDGGDVMIEPSPDSPSATPHRQRGPRQANGDNAHRKLAKGKPKKPHRKG